MSDNKVTIGIENLGERLAPHFPDKSEANILFEIAQDLLDAGHTPTQSKKILKDQYFATPEMVKAIEEEVFKNDTAHSMEASRIAEEEAQLNPDFVEKLEQKGKELFEGTLGDTIGETIGNHAYTMVEEGYPELDEDSEEWEKVYWKVYNTLFSVFVNQFGQSEEQREAESGEPSQFIEEMHMKEEEDEREKEEDKERYSLSKERD